MFERRWGLVVFVVTGVLAVGCGSDPPAPLSAPAVGAGADGVLDVGELSLVSGPSEEVESRGGVAVVPACAVVPIEDLGSAGLPVTASPLTAGARRTRLDAAFDGPVDALPAEINSCWYALSGDQRRGSVRATVLQPALFGHDTALDGPATAAPAGVDVRVVHAGTTAVPRSVHVLRHQGTVVELVVEHLDAQSSRALVASAGSRLAELATTPAGQPTLRHASLRFPGSAADACALTSGSAVTAAFGGVWPFVSERLATTVGTLELGGERHTYVGHRCVRSALDGRDLNVHAATFSHADSARVAFDRFLGRPGVERVPGIGDDAVRGDLPDLDDALAFRVGRVIVHVSGGGAESAAALAGTIALRLGGEA